MNYSNTPVRCGRPGPARTSPGDTVLSLETDKLGTHLRVRKIETIQRRTRRTPVFAAALFLFSLSAPAQFIIEQSTSLFAPSFRNTLTLDAGYTTWFGWTGNNDGLAGSPDDGGFDGATLNELIDNPAVVRGLGGLDGTLNQVGTADLVATSKNVFAGDFLNNSLAAHLTLQIPTNGTPGVDGFTTIILQGLGGETGAGTQIPAIPGAINGISPTYLSGYNAAVSPKRQQWWAKYEIPGNAAAYTVDIAFPAGAGINPGSLRELVVDTQFSATAYAADTAVVPEPSAIALLGGMGAFILARRRR